MKFRLNDALFPAARVSGNVTPLSVNSELLVVADEMVTLDPVALSITGRLLVVPTVTLLKFVLLGDSANCPEAAPAPDNDIVSDEFDAVDISEMLPDALPPVVGAKTAPKVKLCPGARVSGKLNPRTLNAAPAGRTWETVRLELPEFVKVSGRVSLFPGGTLPKLMLEGLAPRMPPVTPVPWTSRKRGPYAVLLITSKLPSVWLAARGVKLILNCTLFPAPRVIGSDRLFRINPEACGYSLESVIVVEPVLVSFADCVSVRPTGTAPNQK